ncbi:hypothetical protein HOLleu_35677 [Holothuria leucospilota]|uniref:Uncharacterized protein n=1 Tax=Holothuria leucospilota TaxID=206669 RepID=A0A9Q1BFJ7_HOLLE|nr:hypothetical protein HOLleu_35677 [Holothuria leucospilota]
MGVLQIIFGVTEFSLGILVILAPSAIDVFDYFCRGIWNGVLAIIAGSLGVSEIKTECVARVYMVTSITIAILCADCFIYAAIGVLLKQGVSSTYDTFCKTLHCAYRPYVLKSRRIYITGQK